jgi:UDP:flavonoid glycosyltransferase YjiC (YdhE family)
MCRDCTADVREVLEEPGRFEGSNRQIVEVEEIDGDDVHLANHEPNPAFHVSHVGELLHWLRDDHFICGVSSGTTAIMTLVGEGKRAECSRCAQNASQIWAVLNALPDVQRDGQSGLAPNPQGR